MTEIADDPMHIFECFQATDRDGDHWLIVNVNGEHFQTIGPFDTEAELKLAHDDLMEMMHSNGAVDMPLHRGN